MIFLDETWKNLPLIHGWNKAGIIIIPVANCWVNCFAYVYNESCVTIVYYRQAKTLNGTENMFKVLKVDQPYIHREESTTYAT